MSRIFGNLPGRLRSRRGVASALIIMLLVLLIFFGVLALVTTAADLRLSRKRADWNQQYYLADARAVKLVAELDQYCRTLEEPDLEPEALAGLLENKLTGAANVQSYQVDFDGSLLRLSVLVAEHDDQGQGIQLTLLVKTGAASPETGRLAVEGWTQWQPPFQYDITDDTNGGIWKG